MESRPPIPKTQDVIFEDVIIRFTRQIYYDDERAFQLEVRKAPKPLPGGAFQADVDAQAERLREIFASQVAVNHFLYRYETPTQEPGLAQDLAELGGQLYELLPGPFRQAFPRLIQQVFEKGQGLRLVLEARAGDKADNLLSLPWETLFFPQTQVFLARSPRVLIVRRLLDAVRRSPMQMKAPFDVTHVIAHDPTAPIDLQLQQIERDGISQAIAPGHYRLVEKPGSTEQMLTALRERPYHIVHFLGHGELYQGDDVSSVGALGRGYLRFINADGATQWVTGEQLQHLLSFTPSVQLVVLNACQGAGGAAGNIALELVYNGLPYVVAIQSNILQEAARHFIEVFYAGLQRGQSMEQAVAVGRAAIAANMPRTIDWCLPVLYTSVGISEQSLPGKLADRLWHWIGSPKASQWLGAANIMLGVLHFIVGLSLWLSNSAPALPGVHLMLFGGLAIIPVLLTAGAYLLGPLQVPQEYPPPVKAALIARSLGSAAIGLGLPSIYIWSILLLLISLGFWEILSSLAQVVLLGLIFVPGLVFIGLASYAQLIGQSRAFISNAQVELPAAFEWSELAIIMTGYAVLLFPWIARTFLFVWFAPPWGNLLSGVLLLALGFVLYREGLQTRRQ